MSQEVAGWSGNRRSRRLLEEIVLDDENINCDDPFPPCAHFQPSTNRGVLILELYIHTSVGCVCMACNISKSGKSFCQFEGAGNVHTEERSSLLLLLRSHPQQPLATCFCPVNGTGYSIHVPV